MKRLSFIILLILTFVFCAPIFASSQENNELSAEELLLFSKLKRKYQARELSLGQNVERGLIEPMDPKAINELPSSETAEYDRLSKIGSEAIGRGEVGIVILAGGMATRFGGTAKATVDVVDEKSFLELKIEDSVRASAKLGGEIPIYIMGSFATEKDIRQLLEAKNYFGQPRENISIFLQTKRLPRMNPDGSLFKNAQGQHSFYATGHGEFQWAFLASGKLEDFRARGGKHLLFSNVDNVFATVDPAVIGQHIEQQAEMTVEVAPKFPGDKGGAPALVNGKPQIVEGFRFPQSFNQDSINVFSTNNLLFSAEALDRIEALPWYTVEKKVEGKTVIQFEQIVGDMTSRLETSYLKISREGTESRFLPIKTRDDLSNTRNYIKETLDYRWSNRNTVQSISVEIAPEDISFGDLAFGEQEMSKSPSAQEIVRVLTTAHFAGELDSTELEKALQFVRTNEVPSNEVELKGFLKKAGLSEMAVENVCQRSFQELAPQRERLSNRYSNVRRGR